MTMNNPERVERQVADLKANYPSIFQDVRTIRLEKSGIWPNWCYMPLSVTNQILAYTEKEIWSELTDLGKSTITGIAAALTSWAATKSVYEFEPELAESLINTRLDGSIPGEVFKRLPNWCVYVACEIKFGKTHADGFFAFLDASKNGDGAIVFVFDATSALKASGKTRDNEPPTTALGVQLKLQLNNQPIADQLVQQIESVQPGQSFTETGVTVVDFLGGALKPALSLVLYLCSTEPDILNLKRLSERPANPLPVKTRKGLKEFIASTPTVWTVGSRIGAAIKKTKAESLRASLHDGEHASPRPHVRAAHWHTYWTGKGRTEPRVKWLSPILVKATVSDELPVVIREVVA